MQAALRIGLVGAGRSRTGLGPFLARFFEQAGAVVVGVSGRERARAAEAAAALTVQLGHPVAAYDSARELARVGLDALVVASPPAAHADGLRAALDAGIGCLCEKPLVSPAETSAGAALVDEFARRDLLLVENCQWPFVLPALFELHPTLRGQCVDHVEMLMAPSQPGVAMVADSLSHLLSVVQALVPGELTLREVTLADRAATATQNRLDLTFVSAGRPVRATFHLVLGPSQPRPAWVAVNGCRIDRRIGENYALSFAAHDRVVAIDDPMRQLVYGFASSLRNRDRDRIREHTRAIALRLRLYGEVLARLGG